MKTITVHNYRPIIITLLVTIFVLFLFRPWFHGIVMIFYTNPMIFLLFISIGVSLWAHVKKKKYAQIISGITFVLFFILAFSPTIMQRYIVKNTDYNTISSLPESTEVRILPKAVANRYLQDSLQKSREKIGGLDIAHINGTFVWTAPRVPDGDLLYLVEKINGIMVADATTEQRKTRLITQKLDVGEDIGIFDNIYWKVFLKKYFIDIDNIYYVMDGSDILTIVPVIKYGFIFPVMVPYFGGIYVVDKDGNMEFFTPDKALKLPYLKDNWIYPESLARLKVDSYKFNKGILNAWFFHKDQIQISDVYGQQNRQPFLMPTDDGLKWIVATEPYGQSYGVFKIFVVDARTGKIDLFELNEDDTLTGPVRVVSYVKKQFPVIDWSTSTIVEPRPYVIDNTLYWMLSITPKDFAGISYTVFVNAKTNKVHAFDTDDGVYSFMQGVFNETKNENISVIEKINKIEAELKELKAMLS